MDLFISLHGDAQSPDELRSLRAWLLEEDELRGCIETRERPPDPGRLGPTLDALQIVAGPAAGVLTASLLAWLKTRVGNVRLVLTLDHGSKVELDAKNVRALDAYEFAGLAERLSRAARGDAITTDGRTEDRDWSRAASAPVAFADSPDD